MHSCCRQSRSWGPHREARSHCLCSGHHCARTRSALTWQWSSAVASSGERRERGTGLSLPCSRSVPLVFGDQRPRVLFPWKSACHAATPAPRSLLLSNRRPGVPGGLAHGSSSRDSLPPFSQPYRHQSMPPRSTRHGVIAVTHLQSGCCPHRPVYRDISVSRLTFPGSLDCSKQRES